MSQFQILGRRPLPFKAIPIRFAYTNFPDRISTVCTQKSRTSFACPPPKSGRFRPENVFPGRCRLEIAPGRFPVPNVAVPEQDERGLVLRRLEGGHRVEPRRIRSRTSSVYALDRGGLACASISQTWSSTSARRRASPWQTPFMLAARHPHRWLPDSPIVADCPIHAAQKTSSMRVLSLCRVTVPVSGLGHTVSQHGTIIPSRQINRKFGLTLG